MKNRSEIVKYSPWNYVNGSYAKDLYDNDKSISGSPSQPGGGKINFVPTKLQSPYKIDLRPGSSDGRPNLELQRGKNKIWRII